MGGAHRIVLPVLGLALAAAAGAGGAASSSPASAAAAQAGGSISGNVRSSTTSLGLAGSIQIRASNGHQVVGTSTLDPAGNYSINLPPGTYTVLTQNTEGYVNEFHNNVPCSAVCDFSSVATITVTTAPITGIDFVLDPGGRVGGTVTDSATGLALSNIIVRIFDSTHLRQFTQGVTDANGNYLTEGGTATGTVYARTRNSQGYVNEEYDNWLCFDACGGSTPIAVTNGTTTGGIDFALLQGANIMGTVTDGYGVPLANVTVTVRSTTEGLGLGEDAITDASGQYRTAGLLPSSPMATAVVFTQNSLGYVDKVFDDGCVFLGTPNCDPISTGVPVPITHGVTVANVDFSLPLGGRIAGAVTNSLSGVPVPVTGAASINVYTLGGRLLVSMDSDSNGLYQTVSLPPGTYFAQVIDVAGFGNELYSGVGCGGCDPTLGTPVTVAAGATTSNIDFPLSATGSISGTVTSETTGSPFASLPVEALGTNGQVLGTATTNAMGVYTISGLSGGASYYVRTAAAGPVNEVYPGLTCPRCDVTTSGGTLVAVSAGAATSNIDFALAPSGGAIRGTITEAGLPRNQVPVQVFNSSNVLVGQFIADGFGVYTTSGLPAGTYYVRTAIGINHSWLINELYNDVSCPGASCVPITGTPVAVTGLVDNINFDLTPGGRISGRIRSSTGVAISGVTVQLFSSTGRLLGTSSGDSFYALPAVPDGTYYLRAVAGHVGFVDELHDNVPCVPDCEDVTLGTPVVVTGGANQTDKDFWLDAAEGAITGTVRDANTLAGLPSAVAVFAADGTLVKTATANANGFYAVFGLSAGIYYARTTNTLGYRDGVFEDLTFCAPSCHVTDGTPITVIDDSVTSGVDFDLVPGSELLQNPGFSAGLAPWGFFATPDPSYVVWQILNGAFHYYRANPPPGTPGSAVVLQNTNLAAGAGDPVLLQFDLANTSDARKRIAVLVHEGNFSDLAVCTFWLPPNTPARRYGMLTHPTAGWTNTTVSFYAVTADSLGGFYQLDNVTLQTLSNVDIAQTQCIDPLLPASGGGAAGPELLVNGSFATGDTQGWGLFGQMMWQVTGGVFEFFRPSPDSNPAGVILQPTGTSAAAGSRFTARFQLGNSSSVRKRVSVLLHDLDFSDLTVCTFWLAPGQPLSPYTMQSYATTAWDNTTISIYAATAGNEPWIRLDDVSLRNTPAAKSTGTECFEPGSNQPMAVNGGAFARSVSTVPSGPAWTAAENATGLFERATRRVVTPRTLLDLTQTAAGVLSFDSRLAAGDAGARVEISVDGGDWHTLASVPESDDWLRLAIDLSPYAGHVVRVRFVLDPDAGGTIDLSRWQLRYVRSFF